MGEAGESVHVEGGRECGGGGRVSEGGEELQVFSSLRTEHRMSPRMLLSEDVALLWVLYLFKKLVTSPPGRRCCF